MNMHALSPPPPPPHTQKWTHQGPQHTEPQVVARPACQQCCVGLARWQLQCPFLHHAPSVVVWFTQEDCPLHMAVPVGHITSGSRGCAGAQTEGQSNSADGGHIARPQWGWTVGLDTGAAAPVLATHEQSSLWHAPKYCLWNADHLLLQCIPAVVVWLTQEHCSLHMAVPVVGHNTGTQNREAGGARVALMIRGKSAGNHYL
jgi:hypothetical protein